MPCACPRICRAVSECYPGTLRVKGCRHHHRRDDDDDDGQHLESCGKMGASGRESATKRERGHHKTGCAGALSSSVIVAGLGDPFRCLCFLHACGTYGSHEPELPLQPKRNHEIHKLKGGEKGGGTHSREILERKARRIFRIELTQSYAQRFLGLRPKHELFQSKTKKNNNQESKRRERQVGSTSARAPSYLENCRRAQRRPYA